MGFLREAVKFFILYLLDKALAFVFLIREFGNYARYWLAQKNSYKKHDPKLDLCDRDVLLICTFRNGKPRKDIQNLSDQAKAMGMVVISSNNQKGDGLVGADYSFNRSNFGRDFGAYKDLVRIVKSQKDSKQVKSVTIANDSVFYNPDRVPSLLENVIGSNYRALAITDNHEFIYHFASYFISVDGALFNSDTFQRFWKKFRPSNLRPRNIKKGELGLSKAILREVPRHETIVLFKRADLFREEYFASTDLLVDSGLDRYLAEAIPAISGQKSNSRSKEVDSFLTRSLIRQLSVGSPAHTAVIAFSRMGMPTLKLDLVYRGVISEKTAAMIASELSEEAGKDFFELVTARPSFQYTTFGLERLMKDRGFA